MTTRTLVGLASVWMLGRRRAPGATAADAAGTADLPRGHRAHRDRRDRRHRSRRADRRPDAGRLRPHDRRVAAACRVGAVHQAGPAGTAADAGRPQAPVLDQRVGRRRPPRPDRLRSRGHRRRRRPGGHRGRLALPRSARRRRPRRRAGVSQRRQHRLHHRSREGEADLDAGGGSRVLLRRRASTTSACRRPSTSTAATPARSSASWSASASTSARRKASSICRTSLESQARSMAMVNRQRGVNSLQTLRSLLTSFAKIDAPKTVVWISEGLAAGRGPRRDRRHGGDGRGRAHDHLQPASGPVDHRRCLAQPSVARR